MNHLLENLHWRYATKKFDSSKKVSADDLETLKEVLRLSASSFGLQAFKFIIIENREVREQLKAVSWNQSQVADASHLIVLCSKKAVDEQDVNEYCQRIATTRNVAGKELAGYKNMMKLSIRSQTSDQLEQWLSRQPYIVLGFLLSACAQMKIDSCPMEGFDRQKYNEILGLEKQGYQAMVICPVGYRSVDDGYQHLAKVRKNQSDLFEII